MAVLNPRSPETGIPIAALGLQVIRNWVMSFNAEGLDGSIDRKAAGQQLDTRINLHILHPRAGDGVFGCFFSGF